MPRSFHLVGQPRGSSFAVEFRLSHLEAAVCVININANATVTASSSIGEVIHPSVPLLCIALHGITFP